MNYWTTTLIPPPEYELVQVTDGGFTSVGYWAREEQGDPDEYETVRPTYPQWYRLEDDHMEPLDTPPLHWKSLDTPPERNTALATYPCPLKEGEIVRRRFSQPPLYGRVLYTQWSYDAWDALIQYDNGIVVSVVVQGKPTDAAQPVR